MNNERDVGALAARLERRESWRARLLDTIPLALFLAVTVVMILGFGKPTSRIATVETKVEGGDARLSGVEQEIPEIKTILIDMNRTIGRLEQEG